MDLPEQCPVCGSAMRPGRKSWLARCPSCGFLRAQLKPEIGDAVARAAVDEDLRAEALGALRAGNFERILDQLCGLMEPTGKRLLDVGCAHGWFLDAASARGFEAIGLEPDPVIGAAALAGGRSVWSGLFPDDVPDGERFDVISFNDVLEHLPDPAGAIEACRAMIRPGGVVVVNAPSSLGVFYRAADLLAGLGAPGPFERLWQVRFASPHLSYFAPNPLQRLFERHGMTEIHRSTLPSVRREGLWARLTYDRSASVLASAPVWLAVTMLGPLIAALPADITLQMFRAKTSVPG